MANVLEELLIKIGIDASALKSGLDNAVEKLNAFTEGAQKAGAATGVMANKSSVAGALMGKISREAADNIMAVGTASQKAAVTVGRAMDAVELKMGGVVKAASRLAGPLIAAFGGAKLWNTFTQQGEALSVLSDQLGVSVEKIDMWAKATEDAGGSAEAMKGALEDWIKSGRGEDQFFRLGESLKGLDERQRIFYLNAMGLSKDAGAAFLKYGENAEKAAKAFKGTVITKEQAERAREFNRQWRAFTYQTQALGNLLLAQIAPIAEKILKLVGDGLQFITEHSRFVNIALIGLSSLLGGVLLRNLVAAAKAAKGFSLALSANPLGAVVAAIVALALAFDDLIAFLEGGNSLLGKFLSWVGFSDKSIDAFRKNLLSWGGAIASIPGAVWEAVRNVGSVISSFCAVVWQGIEKLFGGAAKTVVTVVSSTGAAIKAVFLDVIHGIDSVANFLGDLSKHVADLFSKINLAEAFSKALDAVTEIFFGWIDRMKKSVAGIFDIGSEIKGKVSKTIDGAWGWLKEKAGFSDDEEAAPAKEPATKPVYDPAKTGDADNPEERFRLAYSDALSPEEIERIKRISRQNLVRGQGSLSVTPGLDTEDFAIGDEEVAQFQNLVKRAMEAGQEASATTSGSGGEAVLTKAVAKSGISAGIQNDFNVKVETHIQTPADPEQVGKAVESGVGNAMKRSATYLANASTGVPQK